MLETKWKYIDIVFCCMNTVLETWKMKMYSDKFLFRILFTVHRICSHTYVICVIFLTHDQWWMDIYPTIITLNGFFYWADLMVVSAETTCSSISHLHYIFKCMHSVLNFVWVNVFFFHYASVCCVLLILIKVYNLFLCYCFSFISLD